jgi:hypothetical protein
MVRCCAPRLPGHDVVVAARREEQQRRLRFTAQTRLPQVRGSRSEGRARFLRRTSLARPTLGLGGERQLPTQAGKGGAVGHGRASGDEQDAREGRVEDLPSFSCGYLPTTSRLAVLSGSGSVAARARRRRDCSLFGWRLLFFSPPLFATRADRG